MFVDGLPQMPVADVKLTNVHVEQAREAASFNNTRGFVFSNVTVRDMANPQLAPCWDD